jgi:prepilin-type processing-associated H-X9-DG protein
MRRGFTWVELLVILLVIVAAIALAMPVFLHVREASFRARCLSHLRSLSKSIEVYSAANSGTFPLSMPADTNGYYPDREATVPANADVDRVFWANAVEVNESLTCPILSAPLAYAYNGYLHALDLSSLTRPKQAILLWEGFGKRPKNVSSPRLDCGTMLEPCVFTNLQLDTIAEVPSTSAWTHGRGANFLFVDGHASWRRLGERAGVPTNPKSDPFHEYDRAGRVDRFWLDDDGRAPLFRP